MVDRTALREIRPRSGAGGLSALARTGRGTPIGPSVDAVRDALAVADVEILAGHDHLAHLTAPDELAHVVATGLSPA